ncbi:MAG: serine/threonine protein kinase [Planctomycetes bacterium]|nr:serine/threonine protein kinase [Planctomycetota bacterium]
MEAALKQPPREAEASVPNFATGHGAARPEPPTEDEIVHAFPEFEGFELLGRGGMGVVYKARQKKLERLVALKVLPRAFGADPAFRERFQREARALARLVHQNIVAVHEFGESDGLFFLVLEFVDGVNLRQALRDRQMEPREALTIVRSLCDALQYAHDEGVVHRDIKPENVLLDRAGRVKIADFGLAKVTGVDGMANLTAAGQVMGTPHYMAPEQIERPQEVDHRADLFALGVVMYEMLTGTLPRGVFDLPSTKFHLDVRLDEIVLKALEREPSRRYQHAVEVKTDVEHVEAGPDTSLSRPTRVAREPAPLEFEPRENPLRHMRGFAVCAGLWIVLGVLWNVGPFALGLAVPMVFVIAGHLLQGQLRCFPVLSAELAAAPKRWRNFHRAGAIAVGGLALAVVVIFAVSDWEEGTRSWSPAHRSVERIVEGLRNNPLTIVPDLMHKLDASQDLEFVSVKRDAVWIPGALFTFSGFYPFVLWWGLMVAALCLAIRPANRELRGVGWHVALSVGSQFTISLVILCSVLGIVSSNRTGPKELLQHTVAVTGTPEAISEQLHAAFANVGLQVDYEQEFSVVGRPSKPYAPGAPTQEAVGRLRYLRAASSSPFVRWNISTKGLIRASPQIWVEITSTKDSDKLSIGFDAGRYDPISFEARGVRDLFAELEAAVKGD